VARIFRAYGTNAEKMFAGARFAKDMGQFFGPLSEREVTYLKTEEWVQEADDILWRRSKLGLHLTSDEQAALRTYMKPGAKAKPVKPAKRVKV
jgi:glycerol-3-phosphate dehydrogenase